MTELNQGCPSCKARAGEYHDPECPAVDAFTAGRIPHNGTHVKGGQQARRAALLCANPRFQLYLDHRRRQAHGFATADLPDGTHGEHDAADFIRLACGVVSRAEIDHCGRALGMLERIVADYQRWERQQRGGQ